MSFIHSPRRPHRRPLSADEITAIASAVAAGRYPRNVPGEVSRLQRVDSTWPRKQAKASTTTRRGELPATGNH
jgi:hypothetical protein